MFICFFLSVPKLKISVKFEKKLIFTLQFDLGKRPDA